MSFLTSVVQIEDFSGNRVDQPNASGNRQPIVLRLPDGSETESADLGNGLTRVTLNKIGGGGASVWTTLLDVDFTGTTLAFTQAEGALTFDGTAFQLVNPEPTAMSNGYATYHQRGITCGATGLSLEVRQDARSSASECYTYWEKWTAAALAIPVASVSDKITLSTPLRVMAEVDTGDWRLYSSNGDIYGVIGLMVNSAGTEAGLDYLATRLRARATTGTGAVVKHTLNNEFKLNASDGAQPTNYTTRAGLMSTTLLGLEMPRGVWVPQMHTLWTPGAFAADMQIQARGTYVYGNGPMDAPRDDNLAAAATLDEQYLFLSMACAPNNLAADLTHKVTFKRLRVDAIL